MTATPRHKLLTLISECGGTRKLAGEMLSKHGPDWLTDEQVRDMADFAISSHRFGQKLNRENRRRTARNTKQQPKLSVDELLNLATGDEAVLHEADIGDFVVQTTNLGARLMKKDCST